jgi:DNA-binding MarR family transcriptional regulator
MKYATNGASKVLEQEPHAASKREHAGNDSTEIMISMLNQLIHTLRSKKIPTNVVQAVCSIYLTRDRMLSAGDLAVGIGVSSAAITSVVDGLERRGFALRLINSDDRRSTFIRLTDRGVAFAEWLGRSFGLDVMPTSGDTGIMP